jgi:hypothetical protein
MARTEATTLSLRNLITANKKPRFFGRASVSSIWSPCRPDRLPVPMKQSDDLNSVRYLNPQQGFSPFPNHPRQSLTVGQPYSYFPVFGSPSATLKLLKTLQIRVLKRLASAVQLRPWPPYFPLLRSPKNPNLFHSVPILQRWFRGASDDRWPELRSGAVTSCVRHSEPHFVPTAATLFLHTFVTAK